MNYKSGEQPQQYDRVKFSDVAVNPGLKGDEYEVQDVAENSVKIQNFQIPVAFLVLVSRGEKPSGAVYATGQKAKVGDIIGGTEGWGQFYGQETVLEVTDDGRVCLAKSYYVMAAVLKLVRRATGAELIALERERQVNEEKYDAAHDDAHTDFELSRAALCYVAEGAVCTRGASPMPLCYEEWPWKDALDWKPSTDPIRNLVKAGALIAAEIDRLRRLAGD